MATTINLYKHQKSMYLLVYQVDDMAKKIANIRLLTCTAKDQREEIIYMQTKI